MNRLTCLVFFPFLLKLSLLSNICLWINCSRYEKNQIWIHCVCCFYERIADQKTSTNLEKYTCLQLYFSVPLLFLNLEEVGKTYYEQSPLLRKSLSQAKHHFLREGTNALKDRWKAWQLCTVLLARGAFSCVWHSLIAPVHVVCFCKYFIELSCHQPKCTCVHGKSHRRNGSPNAFWDQ